MSVCMLHLRSDIVNIPHLPRLAFSTHYMPSILLLHIHAMLLTTLQIPPPLPQKVLDVAIKEPVVQTRYLLFHDRTCMPAASHTSPLPQTRVVKVMPIHTHTPDSVEKASAVVVRASI